MLSKLFINSNRQLRNGWWIAGFYLLVGLAIIVCVSLFMPGKPMSHEAQLGLIVAATAILQLLRKRSIFEVTGRFDRHALRGLLWGAAAGTLLMLLPALLLGAIGAVRFRLTYPGLEVLASGLWTAVLVAALEELTFRGFVFRRLQDGLGLLPAVLLTSLHFVLTHMDNPGMSGSLKLLASVNIFMASILFSLALLRSGGLAMPIGLHLAANFVQGSLLGFGVSGNASAGLLTPDMLSAPVWLSGASFGLEASVPGLITVVGMTVILYRWRGLPRSAALPASA